MHIEEAEPYPFAVPPEGRVALLMIDWQRDFLDVGGFGHSLGNNVAPLRAALPAAAAVLHAARQASLFVVHTLEAHRPDLSDLVSAKKRRCPAIGEVLDGQVERGRLLIAGEPGNAIVPEVAPVPGELILHKSGKGAFYNTTLHTELRARGITHLLVTGVTTEVCVQTTLREANDRGYDCLVVSDATESYFAHFKKATLDMVVAQGAIVGWAARSEAVVAALSGYRLPPTGTASPALIASLSSNFTIGKKSVPAPPAPRRTLLAVSGTLQCGFELRANMDHPDQPAILVGSAVVRGVRAYLDVKEAGCREHRPAPEKARVNPANVVTGDRNDANLYAVYLVHEAVVLKALLGEPRYLAIAPDAVRIDLMAPHTSPAVRALLWSAAKDLSTNASPPKEAAILTVLATYHAPSFVPLPKMAGAAVGRGRSDAADHDPVAAASELSGLTSFPEGLAAYAQVALSDVRTPGIAEAALRDTELSSLDAPRTHAARALLGSGPLDPSMARSSQGDGEWWPRLAALWDEETLRRYARAAGFGTGAYGAELATLSDEHPSSHDASAPAAVVKSASAAAVPAVDIADVDVGDGVDGPGQGVMELDEAGEQRVKASSAAAVKPSGRLLPESLKASPAARQAAALLLASPKVAAANERARSLVAAVRPKLVRVRPAREVIAALGERRTILHAGPPIATGFNGMCGPMRGAVIGAILLEGWAASADEAERLAASGSIELMPCHEAGAVGPMSGVVCPSMPVLVVINGADGVISNGGGTAGGVAAYCSLNEGLGKVLRFGAYSEDVLKRLRWMVSDLGPTLDAALKAMPEGGIDIRSALGHALQMGDEGHNRCKALTGLLLQALLPSLMALPASQLVAVDAPARVVAFMTGNAHFGLNVAMGASKLALDAISGVPHCTYVSALARNGVQFGVRVAGLGGRWQVAPSPKVPSAVWFAGFGPGDACRDLGDSAITEALGLGAPAMACAPAIMAFVGGSAADAIEYTREACAIYAHKGLWPELQIPSLDFCGVPMMLDTALVVACSIRPAINTGIAHKEPGVGQIGTGVSRAPLAPFEEAAQLLAAGLEVDA